MEYTSSRGLRNEEEGKGIEGKKPSMTWMSDQLRTGNRLAIKSSLFLVFKHHRESEEHDDD